MDILLAALPGTILAGIALNKKALTTPGTALAWLFCLVITAGGGWTAFTILAATFLLTVAADKLAGGRADPHMVRRKSGTRGAVRVFCNVGVGTMAIALMMITGRDIYLTVYAAVMAESLADSLASKLGPLSKAEPVDICTFKRIKKGLSGGVTLAGTAAELAGAAVIALIYQAFAIAAGVSQPEAVTAGAGIVVFCGFAGAMADSVMGSRLQAKYICPHCGRITEKEECCGTKSACISGFRAVNNDAVNLLSNIFTFMLALILLR